MNLDTLGVVVAAPRPAPPEALTRPETDVPAARWLGATLLALAAGLAALSVFGPLVAGVVDWRISELVENQLVGLDAVSLLLVAPLAAVAGALALRGRPLGAVLGFGPAVYVAYMVPQYVLGPDYLRLAGDNERFFPLLLALFVAAVVTAVGAGGAMDLGRLARSARRERPAGRVLLPIAAVAAFGRYLVSLPDLTGPTPTAADHLAGPTFVWTIALLDLGLGVPASVAACVGIRRGVAWARRALYGVVAWLALAGTAVAGMAGAMLARDDPSMSTGAMAAMSAPALALVALAALLYAPVVRGARR